MTQSTSGFLGTLTDIFNRILGRNRQPDNTIPVVDTAAFQRYADYFDQQSSDNIDRLANKQITIDQWEAAMQHEIEGLHFTAHTIGVGGIENLTADDLAEIQDITTTQVNYLHQWADQLRAQVAAGEEINYMAMKPRARMYRNAADATLQKATLAHVGVPELPAVPRDGSTQCLGNCDCSVQIDRLPGRGNYNVFWRLGKTEDHCPHCPKRAEVWNPMQIRAGKIEPYDSTGLFK